MNNSEKFRWIRDIDIWDAIDKFMCREYKCLWLDFKGGKIYEL